MHLKPGVQAVAPHPAILHAMEILNLYWIATFNRPATITAIRNGAHRKDSFHFGRPWDFREQAFDFRTNDLTPSEAGKASVDLQNLLGDAFDVVLEADHGHVERDVSDLIECATGKRDG